MSSIVSNCESETLGSTPAVMPLHELISESLHVPYTLGGLSSVRDGNREIIDTGELFHAYPESKEL